MACTDGASTDPICTVRETSIYITLTALESQTERIMMLQTITLRNSDTHAMSLFDLLSTLYATTVQLGTFGFYRNALIDNDIIHDIIHRDPFMKSLPDCNSNIFIDFVNTFFYIPHTEIIKLLPQRSPNLLGYRQFEANVLLCAVW